jgi:hypothetical protein
LTAKELGLFPYHSQDAENLGSLFADYHESLVDELLAV